jgi:hypothetical protein
MSETVCYVDVRDVSYDHFIDSVPESAFGVNYFSSALVFKTSMLMQQCLNGMW